jgi:predicted amidohydrolase
VYSTDPADLFSQLYDKIPERLFALDGEAEDWLLERSVLEIASEVEHEALQTGLVSETTVERFLNVEQVDRNIFAILRGLDLAFQQPDLLSGTSDAGGMTSVMLRYLETGRFSTAQISGAVVPKYADPGQDHLIPETLGAAFSALVRVPADTPLPVTHQLLEYWPARTTRERGLYIAALPAFDRNDSLIIQRVEDPVPSYRLRLEDPADAQAWVRTRLRSLDESGAFVGLLPEAALNPVLLPIWQEACHRTPRPAGTHLQWLAVGTGPEHDTAGQRPYNRAVVLDRVTGDIVWTQDKQFRFQLEDNMIERWSLRDELGHGPLEEWVNAGAGLTVVEAPGFRAAIAICEDIGQFLLVGATAIAWGVNYVFCPIFSQAIRRYRWEQQAASALFTDAGIRTIVCNSKWVGDVEFDPDVPSGDVLAFGPDAILAEAQYPTVPVIVRFTEAGPILQTTSDVVAH